MKRRISLPLTAMLACLNGFAQQPTVPLAAPNQNQADRKEPQAMRFCGDHVFTERTFLDALVFDPAIREDALVARWLEPEPGSSVVHTALFTDGRCIATDGTVLHGKTIAKLLPNSLAISIQHRQVAYEALYFDQSADGFEVTPEIHRGVFIESLFFAELDPRKASILGEATKPEDPDFTWDDQNETLVVRPEVILAPAPLPAAPQRTFHRASPEAPKQ